MTGKLREVWERALGLLHGRRADSDLDAEIAVHLEMAAAEHVKLGMSPQDARRLAAIRFGNGLAAKEAAGDQRGMPRLESFIADLRSAIRVLRRKPGSTALAVVTLALGIGVNAAVFTVAKGALFAGFPMVAGNDRILYLSNSRGCCLSYADFLDWRSQASSFTGMAIVQGTTGILSDGNGFPQSYDATLVSANAFSVIGQGPALGRDFMPADEAPGAEPVAILTWDFWVRRFGKDPAVLNRTIRLNGVHTVVVGVMPQGFVFPQKQDLWLPIVQTPDLTQRREDRSMWFAFGRLADGASAMSARAEMETIGRRLGSAWTRTNQGRNLLPHVQTFSDFFLLENESTIYTLMWGAVGFVLLIACANLANLTLTRAMERSREISVRIALGAGYGRLVRQLFLESALLSSLGGALGWCIAVWAVRAYAFADRGPGRSSWRILDYSMDWHVLVYLIAVSLGAAFLFGLAPLKWISGLNPGATMKEGGRSATEGKGAGQLSAALVTAETALAIVLLAGAGVMIRSFLNIYSSDLGVRTGNLLTLSVNLPQPEYSRPETRVAFYDRLRAAIETIPGVDGAAIARSLPGGGAPGVPAEFSGSSDDAEHRPVVSTMVVGPAYFRTLGAAVLSGRDFTEADNASAMPVAIVNSRLATNWPGGNPMGKQLRLIEGKSPGEWLTVVGVTQDIVQNGTTRRALGPVVYLPYRQKPASAMEVIARTAVPPASVAGPVRGALQATDPGVAVFGPVSLDERLRSRYWSSGLYAALFMIFAALALLISSVGLFAVIAHSVGRRTQEIGIRMAIGATPSNIRKLVLWQGLTPAGIGLAIGLCICPAINRLLRSALVQVSPADPLALTAAAVTLLTAAILGCLAPAHHASRVDPAITLRNE